MAMRFLILFTFLTPSMAPAADNPYPFLVGADRVSIILRWAPPDTGFPPDGFNVYRKIQNRTTWKKLNPRPLVKITDEKILKKRLGDDLFKAVSALISPAPLKMKGKRSRKMQDENRSSLLLLYADFSPKVADILGLRWEYREVRKGERYVYRLAITGPGGEEKILATLPQPIGLEDYKPVTNLAVFPHKQEIARYPFSGSKNPGFRPITSIEVMRKMGHTKR